MATSDHDDHGGLARDVATLLGRRRALQLLGGVGLIALVGCSDDDATSASGGSTTTRAGATSTTASGTCEALPEETGGPFPGDGTNGPDVLTESGIVRSDIRSSFGSMSGTAEGVPLTVELSLADASGCRPLQGAAVYLWHCDRDGGYSLYSQGVQDQNYLRGVQAAGADGKVRFTSIFPAAYSGRWPHIHFEIYESVDEATAAGTPRRTTQLALPEDACTSVYASSGYEASVRNLAQTSLDRDMVFSDGYDTQLATVTGSVAGGYTATLSVPV